MSERRFVLFPNGTSHMMWNERNCDRCWKRPGPNQQGRNHACAIESNIALASATDGSLLHDGTTSILRAEKIAMRLKWDGKDYLETDCPEREEKRPPRKRHKAASLDPTFL
jgi:hypothetical protein